MPTEEVFTTPDAAAWRAWCARRCRSSIDGTIVRDLEVRFEGGRVGRDPCVERRDVIRGHVATDDGAARLGEVALVDGAVARRQTGLVFYDTLFDENAASHIAFGAAILQCVPELAGLPAEERHERGVNHSSVHTDFMVGADERRGRRRDRDRRRRPDPPRRRLGALARFRARPRRGSASSRSPRRRPAGRRR